MYTNTPVNLTERKLMFLIENIEETLQEHKEYVEQNKPIEVQIASLKEELNFTKQQLIKALQCSSSYDFAQYMHGANGKKRALEICEENIAQGLHQFELMKFFIQRF